MPPRLVLTSAEQRDLVAAMAALLDIDMPDDARAPDRWPKIVADRARVLFGADFTLLCQGWHDRVEHYSPELPDDALDNFRRMGVTDATRIRCADPDMDPLYAARARFLWSSDLLDAWCDGRLRRTAVYDALWVPTRTSGVVGIVDSGLGGSQQLCVAYQGRSVRRVDRALALLTLLAPAHRAGVAARRLAESMRGTLGVSDALAWTNTLADGVLVVRPSGRELHRNAALTTLLAADPEREALGAALHRMAVAVCTTRGAVRDRADALTLCTAAPASARLRTTAAVYSATATLLRPGVVGVDGAALVVIRRVSGGAPPEPDPGAFGILVERAGLTAREAEVTALLARGRDNAEVAAALGISPHTARHHTEHALRKLGVRSRRAVARLLESAHRMS